MLWCELLPHISAMKPATDCVKLVTSTLLSLLDHATFQIPKNPSLHDAEHHLEMAKQERELYNSECLSTAAELKNNPANPGVIHFSFDFAQQTHFPSSPQQIGALFFFNTTQMSAVWCLL